VAGVKVDANRFPDDLTRVARQVLFTEPTAQTREAITKALADQKTPPTPAMIAGLVIGSPDFQRR
jgi:hypothetical protein